MGIIAGEIGKASDFIDSSAGAGDSGKGVKLNASGKLDNSFWRTTVETIYTSNTAGIVIPTGVDEVLFEIVGGGGSGGAVSTDSGTSAGFASGGGGGLMVRGSLFTKKTSVTLNVVIGVGGVAVNRASGGGKQDGNAGSASTLEIVELGVTLSAGGGGAGVGSFPSNENFGEVASGGGGSASTLASFAVAATGGNYSGIDAGSSPSAFKTAGSNLIPAGGSAARNAGGASAQTAKTGLYSTSGAGAASNTDGGDATATSAAANTGAGGGGCAVRSGSATSGAGGSGFVRITTITY